MSKQTKKIMRSGVEWRGILFALLGFALFSSHDVIIKYLGSHYSVFQIIFFAMVFAAIPNLLWVLMDGKVDNFRAHHPWLIITRSGLLIMSMGGAFTAFVHLPLAEAYALIFITPLLITVFAIPFLGEKVRLQRWLAVTIGLIGTLIVLWPKFHNVDSAGLNVGHAAGLLAACSNAMATILVRKIGREERSQVLIIYPVLLSILVMMLTLPTQYIPPSLPDLALMAGVGLLSVMAQFCIISAYRASPAALVAPSQYSQIIWASIFGYIVFHETLDYYIIVGSALIISSGVFVVWRESRVNVSVRTPVLRDPNPRLGGDAILRDSNSVSSACKDTAVEKPSCSHEA